MQLIYYQDYLMWFNNLKIYQISEQFSLNLKDNTVQNLYIIRSVNIENQNVMNIQ